MGFRFRVAEDTRPAGIYANTSLCHIA